jgi:hypothetical protein
MRVVSVCIAADLDEELIGGTLLVELGHVHTGADAGKAMEGRVVR